MDPNLGTVEAIAITDDVIVAVESAEAISATKGANTVTVDLDGRTVIPGIVDAHTHILTDIDGIAEGKTVCTDFQAKLEATAARLRRYSVGSW